MTLDPRITPLEKLVTQNQGGYSTLDSLYTTGNFSQDGDEEPQDSDGNYLGYVTTNSSNNSSETISFKLNRTPIPNKDTAITAEAYFNGIKEGMTALQQEDLVLRIIDLTAALDMAQPEQVALREETQRLLAVCFLQQKAAALGYDQIVTKKEIEEFRSEVELRRPELMAIRALPRVLPAEVSEALQRAKAAKLFDDYFVLTWNPKQADVQAITDRVVKKDPILFGVFDFDPGVFYYITSWVDETCDLTFDGMIANLKELHPDYEPAKVKPLGAEDAAYLIATAQKRAAALAKTGVKRYRSDALIMNLQHEPFSWRATKEIVKALCHQFKARKGNSRVR